MSVIVVIVVIVAVLVVLAALCRLATVFLRGTLRDIDRVHVFPEWCTECGIEIFEGWAISDTFANDGDLDGHGGGTGMSAYWCDDHRPDDAVPWAA